jgi:putative heme utilization carrier protein HutX
MLAPDVTSNLQRVMAEDPGLLFERVASEHGVPVRAVVEALPADFVRFAPGGAFVEVMTEVAGWGDVTFIVHSADGIIEFSGPVPKGEMGRGYFNLMSRTGLHGHLRAERCQGVAFVERPFMNKATASILFFNPEGGTMFKIFVGRDETGAMKADQLDAFRTIAARLSEQQSTAA